MERMTWNDFDLNREAEDKCTGFELKARVRVFERFQSVLTAKSSLFTRCQSVFDGDAPGVEEVMRQNQFRFMVYVSEFSFSGAFDWENNHLQKRHLVLEVISQITSCS
ncbi:hypothetical protein QVD17_38213 [Tagetes erecta]|uniref:Uncharacterized protein n=1 Tax=Tagetes erecta TaxID=13708 RepID=A0AAD8JZP2_TARER|nr:hypothetical protein QVD17_38213 [Tagetes erecta]